MKKNSDDILSIFGNSLREIRKTRGLSQEDLAFRCGLDRTYISGLERGKRNPTLKILWIIANHLNISIDELLPPMTEANTLNAKDH
ncbi:MAG: helix-turn-helix transcriptional regulator [Burkholderiaceae bacterium]